MQGRTFAVERSLEAALRQSQVVMMLRIQAERLAGMQFGSRNNIRPITQLTGPSGCSSSILRGGVAPRADHPRA